VFYDVTETQVQIFSKYLRLAAEEEIVITRHGRPAGVLIGFASEDDWVDYRIEHHPEFLRRMHASRFAKVAVYSSKTLRDRGIEARLQ